MIIKRPTKKSKHDENTYKFKLIGIVPKYDVPWFNNPSANVVDLTFELDEEDTMIQRETLSFHKNSNFAALIKAITGKMPDPDVDYNDEQLLGGAFIGDLVHITRNNGDVLEVVKKYKAMENVLIDGSL